MSEFIDAKMAEQHDVWLEQSARWGEIRIPKVSRHERCVWQVLHHVNIQQ